MLVRRGGLLNLAQSTHMCTVFMATFFYIDPADPDLTNSENCTYPYAVLLPYTTNLAKEMYATGLAAILTGKKIKFYLNGCAASGAYPEAIHVLTPLK